MFVSLGLGAGLCYTLSLTSLTVFHVCFPRVGGRPILHAVTDVTLCVYFTLADVTQCLYVTSVSPGLGAGLCYTPSVTVISSYFHKYRVVANGVTLASPGIGIVAVPYLLRWLIEDYGWRFALSLCGCFMAQVGTVMSLCRCWEPLCHCVGLGNLSLIHI